MPNKEQSKKEAPKQVKKKEQKKEEQPQENQQQEHLQQKKQHHEKQLRKIGERTQMPTDKAELIQYLSERIRQAEEAQSDTAELLEEQTQQRQKISKSIDQRNKQLQKLYQVDQRGLPQKIKQKLTQILTQTVSQKMQAQQKLNEQKIQNYEFKKRYDQLKWEQNQSKAKLDELNQKQERISSEIIALQQMVQTHQAQLKQAEQQFEGIKQKKEALQDKYLQMKVALQRMTDIKSVFNRFFGNQDLFDEKMDLKEQRVQRVQVYQTQKPPSRQPSRQNRNTTKLKPLQSSRKRQNQDQDFWKGDFNRNRTNNFS